MSLRAATAAPAPQVSRQGDSAAWTLSSLGLGKLVLGPPNGVAPTAPVPTAAPKKKARAEEPRPFWMDPDNHWDSDTSDEEKPLSLRPAAAKTVRRQQEAAAAGGGGALPPLVLECKTGRPPDATERPMATTGSANFTIIEWLGDRFQPMLTSEGETDDGYIATTEEPIASIDPTVWGEAKRLAADMRNPGTYLEDSPLPDYDDDGLQRTEWVYWLLCAQANREVRFINGGFNWNGIRFEVVFASHLVSPERATALLATRSKWDADPGFLRLWEEHMQIEPRLAVRFHDPADEDVVKAVLGSGPLLVPTFAQLYARREAGRVDRLDTMRVFLKLVDNRPALKDQMRREGVYHMPGHRGRMSNSSRILYGYQRGMTRRSGEEDHVYLLRELGHVWHEVAKEVKNQIDVTGKYHDECRAHVEAIAEGSRPAVSARVDKKLFGTIGVAIKANFPATNAKDALEEMKKEGKKTIPLFRLKPSLTIVITDRSHPARIAIRDALRAQGYKIDDNAQGTVGPHITSHGQTVLPALGAAFKTLPKPTQKKLAHPYEFGPSYPTDFEVDQTYRDLYKNRRADPAALEAHLAKCERETGLPRQ